MKYKILDQAKANELLDRIDPPHNELPAIVGAQKAGIGELISDEVFEALSQRLSALKDEVELHTQRFDAEACVIVHQAIPDEADLLGSDGFWRWLALGPLQEIVLWRFPAGKGKAIGEDGAQPKYNRENFGVGASARQRSECYPYKLWLRADLGSIADYGDPYRFARRGDVDFWTSHVLRQAYTTNRALCRALVRFQFPDDRGGKPKLVSGTENPTKGIRGIRTLAKRIKRLQASCELSILEDHELDALLSELADGLTPAQ